MVDEILFFLLLLLENVKQRTKFSFYTLDVQLKPTKEPPKILHKLKGRNYSFPEQTWRRSGSCPEGTIPIRRKPTSADDEAAKRSLPFFSYAHPTDAAIKDEGKGKLEVSHPNYLEQ